MSRNTKTGFSFSTLEKVIETHGIQTTNEFLEQCLLLKGTDVIGQSPIYKAIIVNVCKEYDITPEQLLKSNRGVIQKAKNVCACLFHLEYNLTIRDIARHVFKREFHFFIQKGLKIHKVLYDSRNKTDKAVEYRNRYDRIKNNIKKMLLIKNNEQDDNN